jgi:tetratricopeptide (TPR) repeat protein
VGGEEEDADGIVRTVRYPDDALAEYLAVQQLVIDESETIQLAADELATENDYVLNGPAVRNEQSRLATLNERTDTLLATASEGVAVSRNLIAQSEALVNEANQRIADTRAAIAAFQVNPARNNYAAARDAFLEALALREDPALRENSDELIRAVGAELQELENVIVVRRVRELITAAEELYGQDEYVAARDTLLTAQETWEQTNVEPNTEVDRLLRLVTAALSLEEGRVLTATDPLYPVLGNYLSIAREDFNQGVRLYEAGSTDRANAFFDRSIENLRNVRDVRPLNWDARILELRIAQIRNEEDFDQVFAARFDQAVSRLDEAGPLEVYSELEVLAEINPDYPGIQEQIRRLEIALGLRENPVDQARINRAAELLRRARTLANGSRDEATVAISLLEEAVDLNPRNSDAKFLLDQLRIRLGGQATVALSSADEEQYRRAETLFVQGRALQALQITEQLLQNGANRSYPPLVELRRRIGLRLGI